MRNGDRYADRLVEMARSEVSGDAGRSSRVLSALGVGAVVVHHDWAQAYIPVADVQGEERTLARGARLRSHDSYRYVEDGRLHVFLTPCPAPFIYSASEVVTVADDTSTLKALRTHASCTHRVAVVEKTHVSAPLADPQLAVTHSGPSRYDITIDRAGSYVVVMNTTFSPYWRMHSKSGSSTILAHTPVNGYANAFFVRAYAPDVVQLNFGLQRLVNWTLVAGFALLAISLGVLGLSLRRRTQQRHTEVQHTA
jgi:hypothetical protein